MFKFIHAADIHLDSPLKGLERYEGAPVDEIRVASRRALENLVELAIEKDVDFVLLAGDLYDGNWKDYNTGLYFVSQVVRLREAGISTYVITGNHDAENKMTRSLPLPVNPNRSEVMLSSRKPQTVVLEDLGVALHGRGFSSSQVSENVVETYPASLTGLFNIGLLHTSLDSETDGEHARYAPCKISDLCQKDYDYWALGHIHSRVVRHTDPVIAYPGNIQGRHIRETGAKGCFLIDVDDSGSASAQFVPLDVLRWQTCRIDAASLQTSDDLFEQFATRMAELTAENEGLPLAVRVLVEGRTGIHQQLVSDPQYWTNQLRATALDATSAGVWIEKLKLQCRPLAAAPAATMTDGPISELLRHFEDLLGHEELLSELADELSDLRQKLPDELRRGEDGLSLEDPGQLRAILGEVHPLLIERLLEEKHS